MRKSTYLSATITALACLLMFLWQSHRITALEKRSLTLLEEMAEPEDARGAPPTDDPTRAKENGHKSAVLLKTLTATDLRALWPEGIQIDDFAAVAAAMPKLTEAVAECSTEQLLEIAYELITQSVRRSDRLITKLLLIIIGEDDPASALNFWDAHHQSIDQQELVRSALLAKLAKKDIAMALGKIDRDALHPNDLRRGRIAVAQQLLQSDVTAGLEILAQGTYCDPCTILGGLAHGFYHSSNAIRVACRDPRVAERLWSQVNQIDNGPARRILTEGLLKVEARERGSRGVSEAFSSIENLEQKEHERLLFNTSLEIRHLDPAGTIELFREHSPSDEFRTKKVVDAFKHWVKKDSKSAASWLGEQAASHDRDLMIAQLVEKLTASDAAAAAKWAQEISDEERSNK